jgi:hypothetical protein
MLWMGVRPACLCRSGAIRRCENCVLSAPQIHISGNRMDLYFSSSSSVT